MSLGIWPGIFVLRILLPLSALSNTAPTDWATESIWIAQIEDSFPGFPIHLRARNFNDAEADLANIPSSIASKIVAWHHEYAPGNADRFGPYSGDPTFGPNGENKMNYVQGHLATLKTLADNKGIELWADIRGDFAPHQSLASWNWDFGALAQSVDRVLVQTQVAIKNNNLSATAQAIDAQYTALLLDPIDPDTGWLGMNAVGLVGDALNSVLAEPSFDAHKFMTGIGHTEMGHQWWNDGENERFLQLRKAEIEGTPPPPPPPPTIEDISFQAGTHRELTPGTDNWNTTWSNDDYQYTAGGDSAGFGATAEESAVGSPHRAGLLVARIEGDPTNYTGHNVNGGKNPEGGFQWPPSNNAKSFGVISIGGVLYMWVMPGSGDTSFQRARLWKSTNKGVSWSQPNWEFVQGENVMMPTFLQQGWDHTANTDGFVYAYFIHPRNDSDLVIQVPGTIYLARAPVANEAFFTAKVNWQWWDGSSWTTNINSKSPVISSSDGVGWAMSGCFNPSLGVYLIVTEHTSSNAGNLRFYIASAPQGPWSTLKSFSVIHTQLGVSDNRIFYASFAPKWFRSGGQDFVLIWTGANANDSWNTTQGSFTAPPPPPSGAKRPYQRKSED
jgi:hypothetical protein